MPHRKDIILFDFDGVLIDSEQFYLCFWKISLQRLQIFFNPMDLLGKSNKQFLNQFELSKTQYENLINKKLEAEKYFFQNAVINHKLFQFLISHRKTLNFGIVSNNTFINIYNFLESNNLIEYFECVISSDMGFANKPSPEGYFTAINYFQKDKEKILVIEDSQIGCEAAKSAGVEYLLFNHKLLEESIKSIEIAIG